MIDALSNRSHRRYNPLTGEWVIVSPHRTARPWQGKQEPVAALPALVHDPDCYLCAGNLRANGSRNPHYAGTFVFDNDFPALQSDAPTERSDDGLLIAEGEPGLCRVVCFSPRHDLTLSRMSVAEIEQVVACWAAQTAELGRRDDIVSVQIFENRGEIMGCSNPHPHGQIWCSRHLPNEMVKELAHQTDYFARHGRPLLADYLARELELRERIVFENADFAVLVPFWAVWPFETMVLPKRAATAIDELSPAQRQGLAEALRAITTGYDGLFQVPFPYSMGFHQRPMDGTPHPEWTLHAHFYPPLLRSATIRKYMVGFELLGSPQRDLTPEAAAERLRNTTAERR